MDEPVVERFRPTSGRVLGPLALLIAVTVLVVAVPQLPDARAWRAGLGATFFGLLAWSSMLRPSVRVVGSDLVLRNMVDVVHIPLAAIERVVIRHVLAVSAGGRRFVSPAVSRKSRHAVRRTFAERTGQTLREDPTKVTYADIVESRILGLCELDRIRRGVAASGEEQRALAGEIRRDLSWPVVGGLVVSGLGFVVSLFL